MIIAVLYVVSELIGESSTIKTREVVAMRVIEVPKPKEPEPVIAEPEPAVVPDFGIEPKKKLEPEPPPPRKKPRKKPKPKKITKKPPPPETPAQTNPAPPPRYRVGISMESTVQGGKGPAMATGNSRMGVTPTRARGRQKAQPRPDGTADGQGSGQPVATTRQQRVASNIPTQGSVFIKPKRLTPSKAPYPKTLKAQGIEGDVKVRVSLDAAGRVKDVTVMASSGHQAFDQAARKAALSERFRLATRDGAPVPFTISYSYRFRIEEE